MGRSSDSTGERTQEGTVSPARDQPPVNRMKIATRRSLIVLSLWGFTHSTSPAQEQSPLGLVDFLTYQSDRGNKLMIEMGMFSCGQVTADREAARSLVRLGSAAIPAIERALEAIENDSQSFGGHGGILLPVYAQIKGPSAYTELARM